MSIWKLLLTGVALMSSVYSLSWASGEKVDLFYIERNKNRNQVHYSITLLNGCEIEAGSLQGYWWDLEEGPDVRSDITLFQEPAYGIESQKLLGQELHFKLKAMRDMDFRAVPSIIDEKCRVKTTVHLEKEWYLVKKVYVFAEDGLVMPNVKYLEFYLVNENGGDIKKRVNIEK